MDEDDNQTDSDMVVLFPWQDKHCPFFFYHGEYFIFHRWSYYGVSCVDKSDTAEYNVCHLLKEKGILFQVPQQKSFSLPVMRWAAVRMDDVTKVSQVESYYQPGKE